MNGHQTAGPHRRQGAAAGPGHGVRCRIRHLGGSFSAMDLLTVLYQNVMQVDPADPSDPDRDRFVLSKGHCTPALYPTWPAGYFPTEELKLFRSVNGHMSGHAEMHHVKGVDMSTGSLGQGISAAVGMALAGKLDRKNYRVYTLLGDGEIEEAKCGRAMSAESIWTTCAPLWMSTAFKSTELPPT